MSLSRREFGRLALTAIPAAAVMGRSEAIFGAFTPPKPNSLWNTTCRKARTPSRT
jgi:hypothetical protein